VRSISAMAVLGGVGLVRAFGALAQAPEPVPPSDISSYAIEGAPLLGAQDFSRIVAPYIGRQKSAADLDEAREAIEQAYFALRHGSVQVTLRRPQPDTGVVVFTVARASEPKPGECLPPVALNAVPADSKHGVVQPEGTRVTDIRPQLLAAATQQM